MKKLSTFLSNHNGQSLVETAIMLPILLIIMVGIVELGFALANQMTVTTSAREGARYGARFGPTNEVEVNDAILDVVHETSSKLFSLDEEHADVIAIRAKTDSAGVIKADSTNFNADSYWVPAEVAGLPAGFLQDSPNISGAMITPDAIAADLAPDTAVIIVQVFYDHRSVLGLPIVATLASQIPIATYTVMRIEPSQPLPECCLYPLAIKGERLLGPPALKEGDTFDGWIKDDIVLGQFGWMRWDPASSSGNANALVDRLQHPCRATRDYANPRDTDDTSLNAGDLVMGDSGAVNSHDVRVEMDKLCGARDQDNEQPVGTGECYAKQGPPADPPQIRVPVYDTIVDSGSNFKYQVYSFAIIQILDYYIPAGQEVRLTTRFLRWDHNACKIGAHE